MAQRKRLFLLNYKASTDTVNERAWVCWDAGLWKNVWDLGLFPLEEA